MISWGWLAAAGAIFLLIVGWTVADRRKLRRRLSALETGRQGLSLPEFADCLIADGIDPRMSAAIYVTIPRFSGTPSTFRLHPDDALAVYFDDDDDVFDMACELLGVMGVPKPTSSDPLDILVEDTRYGGGAR